MNLHKIMFMKIVPDVNCLYVFSCNFFAVDIFRLTTHNNHEVAIECDRPV